MTDGGRCDLCKVGDTKEVGRKSIGGTLYRIMKCGQCNHEVVKRVEEDGWTKVGAEH